MEAPDVKWLTIVLTREFSEAVNRDGGDVKPLAVLIADNEGCLGSMSDMVEKNFPPLEEGVPLKIDPDEPGTIYVAVPSERVVPFTEALQNLKGVVDQVYFLDFTGI